MRLWREGDAVKCDVETTPEEADLLRNLMNWSRVRSATVNVNRFREFAANVNGPRLATEYEELHGVGPVVFDQDGAWSLDWWEQVFEEYD